MCIIYLTYLTKIFTLLFLGGGGRNLLRPQQCDQHLAEHNMHSFALSLILRLINCANVCKIKHNLIVKEKLCDT